MLGDQLHYHHSWLDDKDDKAIYALMEVRQETDYVSHHIQKIIGIFLAMREYKSFLEEQGKQIHYISLDDNENKQSIPDNLDYLIDKYNIEKLEYLLPDEYRLEQQLKDYCDQLDIQTEAFDTEHFLTSRYELKDFFEGKKSYLMESFYRMMRKKYDILMKGDDPETGQWNYDKDNRKKIPLDTSVPIPKSFSKDVSDIKNMIDQSGTKYIGNIDEKNFIWPVNRKESLELLDFFAKDCLPDFGTYQDALHPEEWSLFHSRLSFALNTKMLHPLEVIRRVEKEYHDGRRNISISQAEGYIRQILGWREYMRGIYWAHMPEFANKNFFAHKRNLPEWFWNGKTKMKCLSHAINQSLKYAYAHHIQRLMITGNFCLLAGIDPNQIDEWYLGIYIDAFEWVEITNTRGMSQFADGGIVGTKPYVSSANYIDKMGHYCNECHYSKSKKTGEKACPFNSLYWHFYARNEDKLSKNPRIGMMYRTWEKMDNNKKEELLDQADKYLEDINKL